MDCGRESKDERSGGCRMANELLILPLHLFPSAGEQKVEAKPKVLNFRESSQRRAVMRVCEVACLPSGAGLHLGRGRERASPQWAKFELSASIETVRVIADAVSDAPTTPVIHAITCSQWNVLLTDEVPWCPLSFRTRVSAAYKSQMKGPPDAPVAGMVSLQPRLEGYRQRRSRGARRVRGFAPAFGGCSERQNLRVPRGPRWFMGPVSPGIEVTKWPGGTSSRQVPGPLRNRPQQPQAGHAAVRSS